VILFVAAVVAATQASGLAKTLAVVLAMSLGLLIGWTALLVGVVGLVGQRIGRSRTRR
jgi:hypothetical protein